MKRITIVIIALIISGVGVVVASISNEQAVKVEKIEEVTSVGNFSKSDLSSWD